MATSDRALDSGSDARGHRGIVTGRPPRPSNTTFSVILALSFCHLLNDMMQSLVPALYPILKTSIRPELQPGRLDHPGLSVHRLHAATPGRPLYRPPPPTVFPDGRHQPHAGRPPADVSSLDVSHQSCSPPCSSGMGSSIFHPEASRVARMAAGGRYGLAQSLFQVGGNIGSASGPSLAAFVVVPHGQSSIAWSRAVALIAILVLLMTGAGIPATPRRRDRAGAPRPPPWCPPRRRASTRCPAGRSSRRWPSSWPCCSPRMCTAPAWASYYTFYLIDKFHLPVGRRAVLSVRVPRRHRGRHPGRRSGR